jgi:son of sevenless-like protein
MSAIVTGLSSSVVARLHLTWAHVGRASHLDPLARLSDPTTKYALLRRALAAVESPCVPFVAMYLSDLVHIDDEYPDMVPGAPGMPPFINFAKRQKWADAVTAILRHQAKPHMFPEVRRLSLFAGCWRLNRDASGCVYHDVHRATAHER